jgi:uncharacterized membrane protein YqhA
VKNLFSLLRVLISVIALIVFASGIVLTVLGGYDFIHTFTYLGGGQHNIVGMMAVSLLRSIDLFLVAIVFFVFSIGVLALFNTKRDGVFPINFPKWLEIRNFIQLKVILWEAILTTLVVSYLAGLAEQRMQGEALALQHLIIPGAILLIAISLFFLKKGEHKDG